MEMLLVWRGKCEKRWDRSRLSELFSRDENSRPEYMYYNLFLKDHLKIQGPNVFRCFIFFKECHPRCGCETYIC